MVLVLQTGGTSSSTQGNSCFYALTVSRLSHAPKFEGDKFFDLDTITHLHNFTGDVECFGDFNSDRYTDIFVVSENRTTVHILLWDTGTLSWLLSNSQMNGSSQVDSP